MRRLLPALGAAIMVVASVGCARSISEPLGENTRLTPLATVREAGEPVDEFGDGTWIVGTDIEPSTYRDDRARPGCYWARLSGFSGEIQDVIANRTSDFVQTVTIRSTDRGFETGGCGTWKAVGLDLTVPVAPTPVGGVITGLVTRPMPTWPATELLAFVSNRDDNYEIYVMGLDGWGRNCSDSRGVPAGPHIGHSCDDPLTMSCRRSSSFPRRRESRYVSNIERCWLQETLDSGLDPE